uniref:Uncharacterized protein n=1 Tax=Anguilla anguilla TaxID=7936 RepID=A0A0E9WBK7_ANGAN
MAGFRSKLFGMWGDNSSLTSATIPMRSTF